MVDAVSIAVSGLRAQGTRLAAAASNIANISTSGRLPTVANPATTVYRPLSVSFSALTAGDFPGGVAARVTEDPKGFSAAFDPSSVFANEEGFVAVPNVDLVSESVNIILAKNTYQAIVKVIETENNLTKELLNTLA